MLTIKNNLMKAALIFLLFMAAFTVISRVAFGVTAVQVKTGFSSSDKITHQVAGSGQLEGKRELAVAVPDGLAVEQVCVSPGETVIQGATLILLKGDDLQQAIADCWASGEPEDDKLQERPPADTRREQDLLRLQLNGGRVTAPNSGMIAEVNIKAGDKTTGGGDIRYTDSSQGLFLTADFSMEDREYLKKGGTVSVSAENGETISGLKIKSILPKEENPDMVSVTVEVPGKKFEIGTMAELAASSTSSRYDSCVPREALHQETGGYYVYAIKEEKSVLGLQLRAKQVPVELLDRDDTLAAVEGISAEDEVITEAASELADGARVRRITP